MQTMIQGPNKFSVSEEAALSASSGLSSIFWALFFFTLAFGVPTASFAQGPCGGNGQRACCNGAGNLPQTATAC